MDYIVQMKKARRHAEKVKQRQELSALYHANDKKREKIPTSKLALGFAMIDFVVIQAFCMWYMYAYPEYGDLGAFIGIAVAILGQVGALISYYKKSTAENSEGGIVFETTMNQINDDSVG